MFVAECDTVCTVARVASSPASRACQPFGGRPTVPGVAVVRFRSTCAKHAPAPKRFAIGLADCHIAWPALDGREQQHKRIRCSVETDLAGARAAHYADGAPSTSGGKALSRCLWRAAYGQLGKSSHRHRGRYPSKWDRQLLTSDFPDGAGHQMTQGR